MTLLPVDAAEFGLEFFGVERRDVSGVLPRSVAFRAITCICSLERAMFVVGGAAATPPGLRFGCVCTSLGGPKGVGCAGTNFNGP